MSQSWVKICSSGDDRTYKKDDKLPLLIIKYRFNHWFSLWKLAVKSTASSEVYQKVCRIHQKRNSSCSSTRIRVSNFNDGGIISESHGWTRGGLTGESGNSLVRNYKVQLSQATSEYCGCRIIYNLKVLGYYSVEGTTSSSQRIQLRDSISTSRSEPGKWQNQKVMSTSEVLKQHIWGISWWTVRNIIGGLLSPSETIYRKAQFLATKIQKQ